MIGMDASAPRNAWLLLLLISALSFLAAEYMGERHVAIASIMGIAAAKIVVILVRFMEVDTAPSAVRFYLYGWTAGVHDPDHRAVVGGTVNSRLSSDHQ